MQLLIQNNEDSQYSRSYLFNSIIKEEATENNINFHITLKNVITQYVSL